MTGGAIDFRTKRWLAHAGAALGSEDDSLGVVRLSLFAAGFGIRHELATAQSFELFALARGELGLAHASAEASALARGHDPENALFASASAGGEIVARVIDPLALGLTVHGGAAPGVTVLADDRAVTGTTGFMLGVDLSLRYGNASASADRRPSGRGSASSR
jgi:hypothetical protein